MALEFYQGRVLTQCVECWHERVALFTAFCLVDRVRPTCSIMPHKPRGCRVKLPHERETGASTGHAGKTADIARRLMVSKAPTPRGLWHQDLPPWRPGGRAQELRCRHVWRGRTETAGRPPAGWMKKIGQRNGPQADEGSHRPLCP